MPEYKSPGVYIEEVDRGTKPIEAVGTSVTAFLGITAYATDKTFEDGKFISEKSVLGVPQRITNWTEYKNIFSKWDPDKKEYLSPFVEGAYLPEAVYGYFENGGGACYIVSLRTVEAADEAASNIALAKGTTSRRKIAAKDGEEVQPAEAPENQAEQAKDIKPLTKADFAGDATKQTGLMGLAAYDEVRLIVAPDVMVGYDSSDAKEKDRVINIQGAIITHCEGMKYRFAILDTPCGLSPTEVQAWKEDTKFNSRFAALYYPWLKIAGNKLIPPSGHIAGIYNRSDSERGVHKAPANEVVRGVRDLERTLGKADQDLLNPEGINCIRAFPGRGIRVWGARTLVPKDDGAWRYVNVRRLFNMIEASMDIGLQWVVFEPNDRMLWAKVRRDVRSFLRTVWLSGALFGSTPEEAFYVKCDDELNPPAIRDLGQLIIEVGIAPVKPAEFVIFRISQWAGANAEA
ncbi:MAG: phage tail sheath family protein [Anaerolineae bacterium]|nr:phage tail sheath family protein [Anaerolineae bacterium]